MFNCDKTYPYPHLAGGCGPSHWGHCGGLFHLAGQCQRGRNGRGWWQLEPEDHRHSGTVNIIDTVVEGNTTTLAGGGIYCGYNGTNNISGGRISNNTSGTAATTANDATNKYKYGGGAVAVRNNTTTIKDGTLITGNTSGVDGGALYVKNADSRVLPASLTTEDLQQ